MHELGQHCWVITFWLGGQGSERMAAFVWSGGWELVGVENSNQPGRTGRVCGQRGRQALPGMERQEGQHVALCGFAGSHMPWASKFGVVPIGSATGRALRRNHLAPPHKITFKGAQWQGAPAHREDENVQKLSHYESGDLLETNYWVGSESKTCHFPNAFPRMALTFRGATEQLLLASVPHSQPRGPQTLKVDLGIMTPLDGAWMQQPPPPQHFSTSHNNQVPFRSHVHLLLWNVSFFGFEQVIWNEIERGLIWEGLDIMHF